MLVPPADHPEASPESGSPLLTNSVTPFAARLDPQSTIGSPNTNPNSIGGEQFPPLASAGGKVEYTKSGEGKVISTPVAGSNQRKGEFLRLSVDSDILILILYSQPRVPRPPAAAVTVESIQADSEHRPAF